MAEKTRLEICRGFFTNPGFTVQVGETQTLIPMQERFCPCGYLFKLNDGDIVAGGRRAAFPVGIHSHKDPPPPWQRSRDGGHTWYDVPAWPTYNAYQFPDGEILQLDAGAGVAGAWLVNSQQEGALDLRIYRSTDNGYTYREEMALILDVPDLVQYFDRPTQKPCVYAYVDHAVAALSDGSLLATVQGMFAGDVKYRCFIIHSTDRGKTWYYRSSVAFDPEAGKEHRLEGFDEPDLLTLSNGEMLCFMRTGGGYDGKHTPLYVSRSIDAGKSWGVPEPIADRGVYPKSVLTDCGIIAVIYGRPGHWLAFSADQGHTWTGHMCFHHGIKPRDCDAYDWIVQVAPNTLLAAYARTDPNDCLRSEVLGTFFTVERA